MMEEALTGLLLSDTALSALVAGRVHWHRLPDTVRGRPYITLAVVSEPHEYHFNGRSNLTTARVQADVWAESMADMLAVARALSARLSGFQGPAGGVEFRGCFVMNARDLSEEATDEERQLFRRSVDFNISWKEI